MNPDLLILHAVRYLMGKPYTVIIEPITYLCKVWDQYDSFVRGLIIEAIEFNCEKDRLGGMMERAEWQKLINMHKATREPAE